MSIVDLENYDYLVHNNPMTEFSTILKNQITTLPKTTGVYLFYGKPASAKASASDKSSARQVGVAREIIYIGKAINIKSRVKNHFQQPTWRDNLFIQNVSKIGFIQTDSEIEALILEANLIKKHLPKYNVVWKDGKNYFYVAITKNAQKLPYVYITHQPTKIRSTKSEIRNKSKLSKFQNSKHVSDFDIRYSNFETIGPFVDGNALKKTLKFLRKVFPYYTASKHSAQKCTWCHLDLCPGPQPDLLEYKKNIKKLILVLQGKRKIVLNSLKKEMLGFSKLGKFEEAGQVRDKIFALEQVMSHKNVIGQENRSFGSWDITEKLLQDIIGTPAYAKASASDKSSAGQAGEAKKTSISRIECYDISNIQGKFATGSMVVFVNGAPDKSQYKKFKIQMKNEPNDIAMLNEVLNRRLMRSDWPYPQIMLIDGGIAQLNVAIRAKSSNEKTKNIKIISIAKGKRELLIEGTPASAKASAWQSKMPLKNLPQEVYNLIVALDDEAHRFAITYHKKLRKEALLR